MVGLPLLAIDVAMITLVMLFYLVTAVITYWFDLLVILAIKQKRGD